MEQLLVKREGEFSYPIYFENDFCKLADAVKSAGYQGRHLCVVSDTNVAPLYLDAVTEELRKVAAKVSTIVIPAGEPNKNLNTVSQVYRFLIEEGMDRKGVLVALGGGVIGDLTGFCAATYLRGIDFLQVPTTLLAQVDSSVGGKTGVDMDQYKNMVGAFHQPRLVYMNFATIQTLPEVEFACGMGEIVKTGLICDGAFFRSVVAEYSEIRAYDPVKLPAAVRRCCEIKAGVVERDPKEQGERALLNLGHTIGHAVEKLKDFQLHHGQCVGLGLIATARISLNRELLTEEEFAEIVNGCITCGLPRTTDGLDPEAVLLATKKDKKMDRGHIRFVLMQGIGHSFVDLTVTDDEIRTGIQEILA